MIIIKTMLIKFKNDITYHCNDILSEHTKLSNKVFCNSVTIKLKSENNFLNERFTIKFKVSFFRWVAFGFLETRFDLAD